MYIFGCLNGMMCKDLFLSRIDLRLQETRYRMITKPQCTGLLMLMGKGNDVGLICQNDGL